MVQKVTDATMQRLLHENWNPALADNLQRTAPEIGIMGGLKTMKPEGRFWREVAQTGGNFYMAPRLEDEFLPGYDPSSSAEDQIAGIETLEGKYFVKKLYQSVNFTDLMEEITNGTKTGFQNLARLKLRDVAKNIKESVAVRLAGSGHGVVAKIKTVNTGTGVVTFEPMSAIDSEGGNRYVRAGTVYDALAGGRTAGLRVGASDRGRRCISVGPLIPGAGDPSATFNNLAGSTWAPGDFLVVYKGRTGALTTASDWDNSKFPWGILDVIDNGTLTPFIGGLDRSLFPTLQAQVIDTGSPHDPTLPEINQLSELVDVVSGGDIRWLYAFPSHRRFLMKFLQAQTSPASDENPTRYNNPGADNVNIGYGDIGVTTLGPHGTLRIRTSRLAPMHSIFAVDPSSMSILQLKEPGFLSADGLTVRKAFGKATYFGDYAWFTGGIVASSHWQNGVIRNLNGSPGEST